MPNWTHNYIKMKGEKDALDKLINDAVKSTEPGDAERPYHFGSWFPIPEIYKKYDTTNHPYGDRLKVGDKYYDGLGNKLGVEVVTEELIEAYKQATAEQKEKYGAVGWYDWNHKTYGCKWDCYFNIVRESDTLATIECDSPWCAPDGFMLRMSERYPNIEFEIDSHYEDGGNDWKVYNEGCECSFDLDGFQSELNDYLVNRVKEADTIDGEPITDQNREKYLKAVDWYMTSESWLHTSLEDNWDNFEGNVNWIIPDFVEDSEEEESEA